MQCSLQGTGLRESPLNISYPTPLKIANPPAFLTAGYNRHLWGGGGVGGIRPPFRGQIMRNITENDGI